MSAPNAASGPPPECMPQPLPAYVQVGTTEGNPRWVVLQIQDAAGQRVVFLEPQMAQQIGGQIRAQGKQAASNLVIPPPSGLIVPGAGS